MRNPAIARNLCRLALIVVALGVSAASAQMTPRSVFLSPSNGATASGGTINVAISIDDATSVSGFTFGLTYDPAITQVTGVATGTLTSPPFPDGDCLLATSFDNTAGALCVSVACLSPRNGGGSVALISFMGVDQVSGITQLQFGPGLCPAPPPNGCSLSAIGGGPACTPANGSLAFGTTVSPAANLAMATARPGGIACVAGTLAHDGAVVAGTSNDIGFESSQFSLAPAGCAINPAIGSGTTPNKALTATPLGVGSERVQIGGNPVAALPDGVLYTCQLTVNPSATLGPHVVTNAASAAGADGAAIPSSTGAPGQIQVTTCTGDCDGNGTVSIGEVVRCVNLFLGQPLCNSADPTLSCPVADSDLSNSVSIAEVQQCVVKFLIGC